MTNLIGITIGNYQFIELVGRGGMADVYRGIHTHLGREVAIKVLHNHLLDKDGGFVERLKQEAQSIANIHHPNIIQVYDFGIYDDLIFMVMEYVDGADLQRMIMRLNDDGKRLSSDQVKSIMKDISGALDYAHKQGILHRDIKPSNILLDKKGKAYLMDFGIAKIVGGKKLTSTGTLVGTPAYMSPEQGKGEELTQASDIYSLGIVAFEMLTGQVPYDSETPIGTVLKHINDPIPDLSNLIGEIPASLQEAINKALAKSPEDRFLSAAALSTALSTALDKVDAVENIQRPPKKEAADEVTTGLYKPTVRMEGTPITDEFDYSTEVMSIDDEKELQPKQTIKDAKRTEVEPPHLEKITKKKSLLWAAIGIAVVLFSLGIILIGNQKIFGTNTANTIPTKTTASSIAALPSQPTITPTPISSSTQIPTPTQTPTPTPLPEFVELVFDFEHMNEGLILQQGGDWDVEEVKIGDNQEVTWRTGNEQILPSSDKNEIADTFMGFYVDSELLYKLPDGKTVQIIIEYLDQGTDYFALSYDARSGGVGDGRFKLTDRIRKTNSGEFKTAVFVLSDAYFAHRDNDGDFRIEDMGDGAETIRRVKVQLLPTLLFDYNNSDDKLTLVRTHDCDVEDVLVGENQEHAWRTGSGEILPSSDLNQRPDIYMDFFISSSAFFQPPDTSWVRIEVEYLDLGYDKFRIEYDANGGGPYGNGVFYPTSDITKINSGEWKIAVFDLQNVYFSHRLNGRADFRIDGFTDGPETIRSVRIILFPGE